MPYLCTYRYEAGCHTCFDSFILEYDDLYETLENVYDKVRIRVPCFGDIAELEAEWENCVYSEYNGYDSHDIKRFNGYSYVYGAIKDELYEK